MYSQNRQVTKFNRNVANMFSEPMEKIYKFMGSFWLFPK